MFINVFTKIDYITYRCRVFGRKIVNKEIVC